MINTYCSKINRSTTLNDHFLVSENFFNQVSLYDSYCHVDDFSDHNPVVLKINMSMLYYPSTSEIISGSKFRWSTVSNDNIIHYETCLNNYLCNNNVSHDFLNCNIIHCSSICYVNDIVKLYNGISHAYILSSTCLQKNLKLVKNSSFPGWIEHVKEQRDEALR